jgi:hypothetical protein
MLMVDVLIRQGRRSAAVAAFLSMAMVAGLALTSFQPTNEEQELFSSGSPHEDAVLALKLIRTAPDASVCPSGSFGEYYC